MRSARGAGAPDKGLGSAELTERRKSPLICVGVPLPPPSFLPPSSLPKSERRSAQHWEGFGQSWTNSEAACTDPSQDLHSWGSGYDLCSLPSHSPQLSIPPLLQTQVGYEETSESPGTLFSTDEILYPRLTQWGPSLPGLSELSATAQLADILQRASIQVWP